MDKAGNFSLAKGRFQVDYSRAGYILIAALGLAWGLLSYISPGTAFFIAALIAIAAAISLASKGRERRFLLWLVLAGAAARVLLIVIFIAAAHWRPEVQAIWGDSVSYSYRAAQMVRFWENESAGALSHFGAVPAGFPVFLQDVAWEDDLFRPYGWTGYIYMLGVFYLLFGYAPISAKFINVMAGVLTSVFFYYALKTCLNERVARLAAVFIMFFPTLLFWSATNMKESVSIFLTAVCMLALVKLVDKFKLSYALVLILALFLQGGVRQEIIYIASFSLLIAYFAASKISITKKMFFVIFVALFIILTPGGKRAIQSSQKSPVEIFNYHIGHINTPGTAYKILDEKYYRHPNSLEQMSYAEFGVAFARAWLHFLVEPLPWRLATKLQVAVGFPLAIIWYFLLAFFVIGFFQGLLRYRSRGVWAMAIYFLIFSSVIAITGGNVGTLIRMRDMVTPFFLIFAASAIVNILSLPKAETNSMQRIRLIS